MTRYTDEQMTINRNAQMTRYTDKQMTIYTNKRMTMTDEQMNS